MTSQSGQPPAQTLPPAHSNFAVRDCPFARMRAIQFLSLFALAIAVYLIFKSYAGAHLVGCGAASDCDAVLNSRWSNLLGIPVSIFGAALYLVVFITTLFLRENAEASHRLIAWKALAALSAAAIASASWFITLQAAVLHRFCFYCNTEHLIGIVIAAIVFPSLPVGRRMLGGGRRDLLRISPRTASLLIVIGVVCTGALATLQATLNPPPASKEIVRVDLGKGLNFDGDLNDWPVLGSAGAPHLMLELVDYTCPHCHNLSPQIDNLRRRYPGQIGIVILPAPLNSDCNPSIAQTNPMHLDACVLARLVLCVYKADPTKFEPMHHWMYEGDGARTIRDTRAEAANLIGEDALRKELADPWVADTLRRSVQYYVDHKFTAVPTLVFPDDTYTIENYTQKQVDDLFNRHFKLTPAGGTRAAIP